MGKRTRIVNEPSDLVPLLRAFGSDSHKKVFDSLQKDWKTDEEIEIEVGFAATESLDLLKKSGLVESKWRMPEAGKKPEKEYHSSYSRVHLNFQCSVEDISDLIMITFKSDSEIKTYVDMIEKEVVDGNQSMNGLQRVVDKSIMFIRGVARRSSILAVKGQRIELAGEAE
ncbi:MAG: ArsR family transcriptional regulator [Euryarchaeota archaeon]|nr:ArsR family transcriptional regulator [Euryarchaeota archaeon]MBU4220154.1 ArsR family transcriptional regulator [Euryarchaeota archaeon]MBU4340180.1 ArsR family transcriptional regulator [Euryarchaeota archaeon]MCG2737124.1 ArsR family transcriptional regulator [Candidatus Methanoperedenaceae archaeon]MDP3105095.1 ArsR family transcriptional regulator [Candidatus Methanoperedens sp.]